MWIDSHTHVYSEDFAGEYQAVVERAREAGIEAMILPNVDIASLEMLQGFCSLFPSEVFAAFGLHPTSVKEDYREQLAIIRECLYASVEKVVAIGEVGMDLYWDASFEKEQREVLQQQVEWAIELNLPLILHVREAFAQTFDLLRPFATESRFRGVFHSFTGNREELETICSSFPSFCVGINGIVTFKNSPLRKLLHYIPQERLLLETDAPYLAPVPHRGKRNEPAFLPEIGLLIASELGISVEELAQKTTQTARKLFNLF